MNRAVVRSVRALAAMGHPDEDVAQWLDIPVSQVRELQTAGEGDAGLCAALEIVFAERADQVGRCVATRERARRAGWRTAMAYPDGAIDQPAEVTPLPQFDTGADVAEQEGDKLIRSLAGQGWSDARIGQHLRINEDTIQRRRTALGVPPGARRRAAG